MSQAYDQSAAIPSKSTRAIRSHAQNPCDANFAESTRRKKSVTDIEVTDRELRVTLAPMSSAHRTRAITALCDELNRTETIFPGSRLRLTYAIRGS